MTTQVVNVRFETCDVYIGRTVHGYVDRGWGNHNYMHPSKRKEMIAAHMREMRKRIAEEPGFLQQMVDELQGRKLGCWCYPASCHGDNYIQLLKEYGYESPGVEVLDSVSGTNRVHETSTPQENPIK